MIILVLLVALEASVTTATESKETSYTTGDGRAVTSTFEECRKAAWGEPSPNDIELAADCLEANIYDPCGDADSYNEVPTCIYYKQKVADRRIERAEQALNSRS